MSGFCSSRLPLPKRNVIPSAISLSLLLVRGGDGITSILWCSRCSAALSLVPCLEALNKTVIGELVEIGVVSSVHMLPPSIGYKVLQLEMCRWHRGSKFLASILPWFIPCNIVYACCWAPCHPACLVRSLCPCWGCWLFIAGRLLLIFKLLANEFFTQGRAMLSVVCLYYACS